MANRIIARIADDRDANWTEVLEYGMTGVAENVTASTISKDIAEAFASDGHLDSILDSVNRIETVTFEEDVKAFLASELRRMAAERKVEPGELCDVSTRTLRRWAARRKSAAQ